MGFSWKSFPALMVGSALFAGCATVPIRTGRSPSSAKETICTQGEGITRVTGSVWVWYQEDARSAQFPALVRAEQGGVLALEIVDLLGSPQARIEKKAGRYLIRGERAGEVEGAFRELFEKVHAPVLESVLLGGFPCPSGTPRWEGESTLVFPDGSRAELKLQAGKPWLETWTSGSRGSVVEWRFLKRAEDGSPSEWEAFWKASGREGTLRIRWRDRKVDRVEI